MHHEFPVAMLMETLQASAIAADSKHSGRGVARKDQPFWIEGVELRVDHGPLKWNDMPARSIGAPYRYSLRVAFPDRGSHPFAPAAKRAFAQLRPG